MLRTIVVALCAAACLLAPAASAAPPSCTTRTYKVDDLLRLEELGQIMFSPSSNLLIVERLERYDAAGVFSNGAWGHRSTSRVLATDDYGRQALRPLFPQHPGSGYWIGSLSPDKRQASVFRLTGTKLDMGVVDLRSRVVRWLDVIPDLPLLHHAPEWIDEHRLAVVAMPTRRLPLMFGQAAASDDAAALWHRQAGGREPSAISLGSHGEGPRESMLRTVLLIDTQTGASRELYRGAAVDISVARNRIAILTVIAPVHPASDQPLKLTFNSNRFALETRAIDGEPQLRRVADDVMPGLLTWSSSGARLLYATRDRPDDWARPRLQVTTFDGPQIRNATMSERPLATPDYATSDLHVRWAGEKILMESRPDDKPTRWLLIDPDADSSTTVGPAAGVLLRADATSATFHVDRELWSADLASGISSRIMRDVIALASGPRGGSYTGLRGIVNAPLADQPIVTQQGKQRRIAILREDGALTPSWVLPIDGEVVAGERGGAAVRVGDRAGAETLWLATPGASPIALTTLNRHLEQIRLPRLVDLTTTTSDGQSHHHWLLLPCHPTAKPRPLLAIIYPGSVRDKAPNLAKMRNFMISNLSAPVLTGQGYAVLLVSLPFTRKHTEPLDALTRDVADAVDAAIKTGQIDPDQVALLGHSFGGYGVLAIGERSQRYRALVAENAPGDLGAGYGGMSGSDRTRLEFGLPFQMGVGWFETGQGEMGVPPWQDPIAYVRASPAYALDRIRTPLLLIGGDQDFVSVESAERTFLALARLGRDVTLLRYWGEGHDLASPANIRDYYRRLFAFLDRSLATAGAPEAP